MLYEFSRAGIVSPVFRFGDDRSAAKDSTLAITVPM